MKGTPKIYRKKAFSGATKPGLDPSFPENRQYFVGLTATPYKGEVTKSHQPDVQRWVNEVRREAGVLSEELVEWYTNPDAL